MTPQRFQRLRRALQHRQPDLTVILEGVSKPHNLSAIVRSADAAGVLQVHAISQVGELSVNKVCSSGVGKWVPIVSHPDLAAALGALPGGTVVVAAHPGRSARDFRELDYTRPSAILLGQEKDGLTPAALAAADERVAIPMLGLGRSLNVSVAAALVLFEAARQRREAGLYERSRLDPELFRRTLFEWAHPDLARHCRQRGVPYPALDEDGELAEPASR